MGDGAGSFQSNHCGIYHAEAPKHRTMLLREVALMTVCSAYHGNLLPPAVQAESSGVLWVMERATFRAIIVVSTMQKRQRYEEMLQSMPLFSALMPEQRAAIADCLSLEAFQVSSPSVNLSINQSINPTSKQASEQVIG